MPDVDFHGKYHHSYRQHRRYSRPSKKEETFHYRRRGPLNPETGCPWGMSPMCREDFLKAQAAKNSFEASHGTVKKLEHRKLFTFEELSSKQSNYDVLMTEMYSGEKYSQYQTRLTFDEDSKDVTVSCKEDWIPSPLKSPAHIKGRQFYMTESEVEGRIIPPFALLAIRSGAGESLYKNQLTTDEAVERKRKRIDLNVTVTSKQRRCVTFSEATEMKLVNVEGDSQNDESQPQKKNEKRRRVWRRQNSEVTKVTPRRTLTRLDESVLDLTS